MCIPTLNLPDYELIHELLQYDKDSGALYWRKNKGRARKGQRAGYTKNPDGYWYIRINGRDYLQHRIIWKLVNKVDPLEEIDHINRNPLDNRLSNLREATRDKNNNNRKTGVSGIKGAYYLKSKGKFKSVICIDNVNHYRLYAVSSGN